MSICLGGLLSKRALLLAKVQTALGVDPVPTAALDAILVSEPEYSIDPNLLERVNVSPDLSPFEHIIGRKLASVTFTSEVKSNGIATSGALADEPKLGRLLRGCGYESLGLAGYFSFNAATAVDDTAETITLPAHGFVTADGPIQFLDNGNTLPTGVAEDTDYWVIRVDDDTIKVSTSRANALAGTAINLTDGTGLVLIENLRNITEVNPDPSTTAITDSITRITRGHQIEADRGPEGVQVTTPVLYTIEVTLGGASATAEVTVTNNNTAEDDLSSPTPQVVTSGSLLKLGESGATFTIDFTGDLTLGSVWHVMVYPNGIRLKPVSECFDYLTLYLYNDGLLFKLTDAQGSFTIDATAGGFPSIQFTFTGQYHAVVDAAIPTDEVYEATLPQQIELSLFSWGSNNTLITDKWTYDQANTIVPRPDINQTDGFSGVRLTERRPSGAISPQAELVASEDFWGDFASAYAKTFTARIGSNVGNQVVFYGPRVQVSQIAFGDRDNIRVFDLSTLFKRLSGDDEFEVVFC